MRLKCIGSSSKGNCYIIGDERETLILEAGVSFQKVNKALNFDLSRVVGLVVSHEHGDHSQHMDRFVKAGIPTLAPPETFKRRNIKSNLAIEAYHQLEYKIGGFTIKPFDVEHDVKTLGYLIYHEKIGKVLFITDTSSVDYRFKGLNNIIIEANHSHEIIDENVKSGIIPHMLGERIKQSHMSIDSCVSFLDSIDRAELNNIVLIHLSDTNSNEELFKQTVLDETGNTVHIAKDGLDINFNKKPF